MRGRWLVAAGVAEGGLRVRGGGSLIVDGYVAVEYVGVLRVDVVIVVVIQRSGGVRPGEVLDEFMHDPYVGRLDHRREVGCGEPQPLRSERGIERGQLFAREPKKFLVCVVTAGREEKEEIVGAHVR